MKLSIAEKLEQAGIKKYGSLEAYKKSLAERGRKGGKSPKTSPAGFAADPSRAKEASKKGLEARWNNGKNTNL